MRITDDLVWSEPRWNSDSDCAEFVSDFGFIIRVRQHGYMVRWAGQPVAGAQSIREAKQIANEEHDRLTRAALRQSVLEVIGEVSPEKSQEIQ